MTGPDEYTAVVNDNLYHERDGPVQPAAKAADAASAELKGGLPTRVPHASSRGSISPTPKSPSGSRARRRDVDPVRRRHSGSTRRTTHFLDRGSRGTWKNTAARRSARCCCTIHPLVIYRHQVLKQADVVLAMFLQRRPVQQLEQKRRNFDYYDPITTGDSSLSACVQSIIAAEVGYRDLAAATISRNALFVDLADSARQHSATGSMWPRPLGVWNIVAYGSRRHARLITTQGRSPSIPGLPGRQMAWFDVPDQRSRRSDCKADPTSREIAFTVVEGNAPKLGVRGGQHFIPSAGKPVRCGTGRPKASTESPFPSNRRSPA